MALKVKDLTQSATKWDDNASRASDRYATEAAAAGDLWARNAAAAKDNYHAAISMPNLASRFQRGVQRAGAAKYAKKITAVAADRFAPGIHAAIDDWKADVEPYFSTLAALTLDARKPRGDIANYKRVEQVGKALNTKRLALLAAAS